jgi:copper transport protein
MNRIRILFLVVATVVGATALVLTTSTPASAHAVVTSSTPTDGQNLAVSPQEVQITFSEGVSSDLGGLTVLNSSGDRVDNNDSKVGATGTVLSATVQPDLTDGTYVMNYRVVSADGHPIAGAIVFGVGDQTVIDTSGVASLEAGKDPGFEFAAGVARFITYLGALLGSQSSSASSTTNGRTAGSSHRSCASPQWSAGSAPSRRSRCRPPCSRATASLR